MNFFPTFCFALIFSWGHCAYAQSLPPEAKLTGSDVVDAVVRDFWDIQDSFESEASHVHVAGGLVTALGLYNVKRQETTTWHARFVAGPAASLRVTLVRQAPRHLAPRILVQLERLIARLEAAEAETSALLVELEREHNNLTLEKQQWQTLVLAPPKGGNSDPAAEKERTELAKTMHSRLNDRLKKIKIDQDRTKAVLPQLGIWKKTLWSYHSSVASTVGRYLAAEVLLGYGFDIATNPTETKAKSGVLGGAGIAVNFTGITCSVGVMAHHAAMLGPYLTVGTWIE